MKYVLFFLLLLTGTINLQFYMFGVNIAFLDYVVLIILIILFFDVTIGNGFLPRKFKNIFLVLLGYYIFIMCYSSYIGANVHEIGGRFRNLYVYPLMFFAGFILTNKKKDIGIYFNLIKLYIIIAIGFGVAKIYYPSLGLLLLYKGIDATDYYMLVQFGTGLLAGLALVHQLMLCSLRKTVKIKDVLLMIVFAMAIIGTQNRSTVISATIPILIAICYVFKSQSLIKNRRSILVFSSVIFVVIMLVTTSWLTESAFYEDYIYTRLINITSPIITYDNYFNRSITTRLARVGSGLTLWMESPLIGKGWKGIGYMHFIDLISGRYIYTLYNSGALSYYVSLLLHTGIIGFIIMMTFWWNVFKELRQSKAFKEINIEIFSILMFLISYMIFATFNYNLSGDAPFIACGFYIFGIGVGYNARFGNKCDNKQWLPSTGAKF